MPQGQPHQHPQTPPSERPSRPPFNTASSWNAPVAVPKRPEPYKAIIFGTAGLVLGIILGSVATIAISAAVDAASAKAAAEAEANKPRPFPEALSTCELTSKTSSARLGDSDRSLSLDGEGEEDFDGLSISEINCVLDVLDVPDSIRSQMSSTRALDGMQRDSWESFSISWNYHPNSGLSVNLSEK